ncbi:hypothetical protein ABZ611_28920 [Streptomyces sp. NPDC007861]|uniref:hypothetical protein n=1 Tax=Streptomyces sp. NPDC007861 TaxID=3154893 RepID=UPI0033F72886
MTEPTTDTAPMPVSSMPVSPAPPMPQHPLAAPAVPAPPAPVRDRRVLRAVARWTVAVLVCGGLGAGTALGITSLERTDVPGLATENDGRWDYPKLSLPALPKDTPWPFSGGSPEEIHHTDLRRLLLPAPAGATVDKKLTGGWATPQQYSAEYGKEKRAELELALKDYGLRHIAARGWTMPDGTTSRVYLLRFDSAGTAEAFKDDEIGIGAQPGVPLEGTDTLALDSAWSSTGQAPFTSTYVFAESAPVGAEQTRQAYVIAGDTLALIVQSRKEEAAAVPFHQTVALQNQLLG